ncbi:hypothetical protein Pelo_7974 [Pelomyxa schiedti]|nr:hypothetical protein Pelo_7974 [Pelomyxa schiedti]
MAATTTAPATNTNPNTNSASSLWISGTSSSASSGPNPDTTPGSSASNSAASSVSSLGVLVVSSHKYRKHSAPVRGLLLVLGVAAKVVCSLSAAVLVIACIEAVVPAVLMWQGSVAGGMVSLRNRYVNQTVESLTWGLKDRASLSVDKCERAMRGASINVDFLPRIANKTDVEVFLERGLGVFSVTTSCGYTMIMYAQDGIVVLLSKKSTGGLFSAAIVQRGYDLSNLTVLMYSFDDVTLEIDWSSGTPLSAETSSSPYLYRFSTDEISAVSSGKDPVWGPILLRNAHGSISLSAELKAGWHDPSDSSVLRGALQVSVTADELGDLFTHTVGPGVICAFLMQYSFGIISSSCENAIITNGTVSQLNVSNSSLEGVRYVQDAWQELNITEDELVLSTSNRSVITTKNEKYLVSFAAIHSADGFSCIAVLVLDLPYFDQTYKDATAGVTQSLVIGLVLAIVLGGLVAVLTFLGQWEVMSKIQGIISTHIGGEHVSPGPGHSKIHPSDEEQVSARPIHGRFNFMSHLTEIGLILHKLDWLEGKVKIVSAFLPVVAKAVCGKGLQDEKVLQSTLSRRLGCYMFCDIENFTPLCEAVPPDVAARVLEVFYTTTERAARILDDNVLVKRLGDGVFLTWGFKLEIEKEREKKQLPVIAYAAALKIGEAVSAMDTEVQYLLAGRATGWRLVVRIGLTTGPALHGLFKTEYLISPDVVGSAVNLAARCQSIGKMQAVRELSQEKCSGGGQLQCTIVTDLATSSANTNTASKGPSGAKHNDQEYVEILEEMAKSNIDEYPRFELLNVPVQGMGELDLTVTFIEASK